MKPLFILLAVLLVLVVIISGCASITGSTVGNSVDIKEPDVPSGGPPLPPVDACDIGIEDNCENSEK